MDLRARPEAAKRGMTREQFIEEVVSAVKAELRTEKWFTGVCTNGLDKYYPDDLRGAIQHAIAETQYWDADWPPSGFR